MPTFQARARTIDMLGRQQIAGIPTAISELFKNAHDAYASNVVANYLRESDLFVLRDDGTGMTREEFTGKWLTLGTESRLQGHRTVPPKGKARRHVLGEKGIGRLAIAALGPQVLVLTKSYGKKGVAAFVNWRFFEIPGLNLDQIGVPLIPFQPAKFPDISFVRQLTGQAKRNATLLKDAMPHGLYEDIMRDLSSFSVDPLKLSGLLNVPNLRTGTGTQFYISPVNGTLAADIDGDGGDEPSKLITTLLGFTNTMTPRHPRRVIKTAFYDHRSATDIINLIRTNDFFTPDEFSGADHHIAGEFNQYGNFKGTIRIYGNPAAGAEVPLHTGRLTPTACGPFRINVAVVQGAERQSLLSHDRWNPLARKMDKLGGLYIYNDNVRVLPYGNADYDFLEIERNRTKSASYYYFSYRRLFGVIELSRDRNPKLREKAGREGFIENAAYREFRSILMNFFVTIAGEFFREGGAQAEEWSDARSEIQRAYRAKEQLEHERAEQRKALRDRLDALFKAIKDGEPNLRTASLTEDVRRRLEMMPISERTTERISSIERDAYVRLAEIRTSYLLDVPRGFGKDRDLQIDIDAHRREYEMLEQSVFQPALKALHDAVTAQLRANHVEVDERRRVSAAVRVTEERAAALLRQDAAEISSQLTSLADRMRGLVEESQKRLASEYEKIESELTTMSVGRNGDAAALHASLGRRIEELAISAHQLLEEFKTQVSQVGVGASEGRPSQLAVYEAMDSELLELRRRTEDDLELAQLGMAVQVINHEFDTTVRAIRTGLRELRPWAKANGKLEPLYRRLVAGFNHLDAYLGLFTPLQRRLRRTATVIAGSELHKFLGDLFAEALRREGVQFQATTAFKQYRFTGFPSTFYPVFVNVVENAIFWLHRHHGKRDVVLDVRGDKLLISNTGPTIPERERSRIFEYGFSRKPSGQGLGLFISRQVLRREGFDIAVTSGYGVGVTFVIERAGEQQ